MGAAWRGRQECLFVTSCCLNVFYRWTAHQTWKLRALEPDESQPRNC